MAGFLRMIFDPGESPPGTQIGDNSADIGRHFQKETVMNCSSQATHLDLLRRARAVLASDTREPGKEVGIIADLDSTIERMDQMPFLWPVPIYLGTIGHRYGTGVAVAVSHKGLLHQVAAFCRAGHLHLPVIFDSEGTVTVRSPRGECRKAQSYRHFTVPASV